MNKDFVDKIDIELSSNELSYILNILYNSGKTKKVEICMPDNCECYIISFLISIFYMFDIKDCNKIVSSLKGIRRATTDISLSIIFTDLFIKKEDINISSRSSTALVWSFTFLLAFDSVDEVSIILNDRIQKERMKAIKNKTKYKQTILKKEFDNYVLLTAL